MQWIKIKIKVFAIKSLIFILFSSYFRFCHFSSEIHSDSIVAGCWNFDSPSLLQKFMWHCLLFSTSLLFEKLWHWLAICIDGWLYVHPNRIFTMNSWQLLEVEHWNHQQWANKNHPKVYCILYDTNKIYACFSHIDFCYARINVLFFFALPLASLLSLHHRHNGYFVPFKDGSNLAHSE